MKRQELKDKAVAERTGLSRPTISRIRRGKQIPARDAAVKLQALTGIAWWKFIEVEPPVTAAKGAGRQRIAA
jgi:transcriptional regulator with XRE-family HTH domain